MKSLLGRAGERVGEEEGILSSKIMTTLKKVSWVREG